MHDFGYVSRSSFLCLLVGISHAYSLMHVRTPLPGSASAPSGESPAGGSRPQESPSTSTASAATSPPAPSPPTTSKGVRAEGPGLAPEGVRPCNPDPTAEGVRSTSPGPETEPQGTGTATQEPGGTPQDEVAPRVVVGDTPVATALPGLGVDPSSSGPAEAGAPAVEAARAEDPEAPGTDHQRAPGTEPEMVFGGRPLPCPTKVPLPRLIIRAQRATEELEEGFRREWEELEAERFRLADWEHRLRERVATSSSRHAEERAQLEREREVLEAGLRETVDRAAAVALREQKVLIRETTAAARELRAEEKAREAEKKTKAAETVAEQAKEVVKKAEEKETRLMQMEVEITKKQMELGDRELAAALEARSLASRAVELEVRAEEVNQQEAALKEREAAFQAKEAKMRELLAERDSGISRIARWVDEVNPTLGGLGLSPIPVAEAPSTLDAALLALDSTSEQLRQMEDSLLDRLESEGRAVARMMAEHVLTCFRSHDPDAPLTPVLLGPVPRTAAAAREGVQGAVEIAVSRIKRRPGPGPVSGRETPGAPGE
jgi:hypothetical protein